MHARRVHALSQRGGRLTWVYNYACTHAHAYMCAHTHTHAHTLKVSPAHSLVVPPVHLAHPLRKVGRPSPELLTSSRQFAHKTTPALLSPPTTTTLCVPQIALSTWTKLKASASTPSTVIDVPAYGPPVADWFPSAGMSTLGEGGAGNDSSSVGGQSAEVANGSDC